MIEIKNFTESDFEFEEITRLYNLVSHDDKEHVDDIKESWETNDKNLQRDNKLDLKNSKEIFHYERFEIVYYSK